MNYYDVILILLERMKIIQWSKLKGIVLIVQFINEISFHAIVFGFDAYLGHLEYLQYQKKKKFHYEILILKIALKIYG